MGLEHLLCAEVERCSKQILLRVVPQSFRMSASSGSFQVFNRIQSVRRFQVTPGQPSKDVVLFQHDRTRFFRLLSFFCGGQALFWAYVAHFAYTSLRDTGGAAEQSPASTSTGLPGMFDFDVNLGSTVWRHSFTLGSLAVGTLMVGFGVVLCRRSVSQVVLHKGGRMVTVCTQSPLGQGRGRKITVPLSQVACHANRHESPLFIPLRIKGHRLYFLLDKEGTLNNPQLFDVTVGAYRPF